MSNPILRLSRQNEATWTSFHRRVSGIHYNYDQLFPETVFQFLEAKAKSVGSSIGYLVPSLMTATSFLLGNTDAHFLNGNHIQPLNLYTMSVGHPGTGKSPAIETVLAALRDIDTISKETLVRATTSSGLVKTISKQGKAFVVSPEIFDVLNKLLKNDKENVTGDVQLLCKLWSGESASYHFATEATREIESNTAFSVLGSTQIQNAAILIFRMDKGHGLLDRFLITVPNAQKPTPEQEEEGAHYLADLPLQDFVPLFAAIYAAHKNVTRSYTLDPDAAQLHKRLKTDHVNAVNNAIENGEVPPKSKGTDLVTRVAVALSTISYFLTAMLEEDETHSPPEQITEDCYKKAVDYVEYLHAQKEMFAEFVKAIVEPATEKPRAQPTEIDISTAIIRFPGRLVTYQAFKKFSPRSLRSVQKPEYDHCTQTLKRYGRVEEIRVPRSAQKVRVFIKKTTDEIVHWPADAPCMREEYGERISEPVNRLITENIRTALVNAGHITRADIA